MKTLDIKSACLYKALLPVVMILIASVDICATTYYLYGCTDGSTWSNTPIMSSTDKTFEITNSTYLAAGTEFKLGVSKNSNGYKGSGLYQKQIYRGELNSSGSAFDYVSNEDSSYDGCNYAGIKYKLKNSVDKLTLTLTPLSSDHNCGDVYTEEKKHTYSLSVGSVTSSNWVLCGDLPGLTWDKDNSLAFTGSGSVKSLSLYLPANTNYPSHNQNNHGFKVVDKTNNAWYSLNNTTYTGTSTINIYTGNDNFAITTVRAGLYLFEVNTTSNPKTLKITYPSNQTSPLAYWGSIVTEDGDKDLQASVYIKQRGCDGTTQQTVDKIKVRYWKKSDPDNMKYITLESGPYAMGNVHTIEIPHTDALLKSCLEATDIVLDVAAHSGTGWSDYSDIIVYKYTASNTFETFSKTFGFTACDGMHEFNISDVVLPTTDITCTVTLNSSDASDHFEKSNGSIILSDGTVRWKNFTASAGDYVYTFTFSKEGFTSKSQNVTIRYSKTVPTGGLDAINTSITPDSEGKLKVTSWVPVTLTATAAAGSTNISGVKWTANRSAVFEVGDPSTTATFRAKSSSVDTEYTITAIGMSETCIETEPQTVTIYISPDNDDC